LAGSRPVLIAPSGVNLLHWKDALRRQDLDRLASMLSGTSIGGRFRPFGPKARRVACAVDSGSAVVKPWTQDSYLTRIQAARSLGDGLLVDVRLSKGFRHQIRAHLAWVGLSLAGDPLYGEGDSEGDGEGEGSGSGRGSGTALKLLAYALAFADPASGASVTICIQDQAGDTVSFSAC
jgi:hypothetical protein